MKQYEPDTQKTWTSDGKSLRKNFYFEGFHEVMAFVNAVAWIAHKEDHHPDLSVHYNWVEVVYTTHDTGGLTDKDHACALQVDQLFRE